MDDLISRQQAIEVLRNRWLKTRNYDGIGEDIAEECEIYLKTLPSVQPEPRTAYWTKDIVGSVVCSYCGGIREDNRIGHTQWCNCCGCFMRGEEND